MDSIIIRGAREHNLKNVSLVIPRNKLVVITGLSGSGKSSLAFDTIYAEGQRRYVESLSSYARQFLEQLQKPDVEYIEGLSPAIAIEQRGQSNNPRSIVGTQTEIYDYLRLAFARIGEVFCHQCGRPISRQSSQQIVERLLKLPVSSKVEILAPLARGRKGEYKKIFDNIRKAGFTRIRLDGKFTPLHPEGPAFQSGDEEQTMIKSSGKTRLLRRGVTGFTGLSGEIVLDKKKAHNIEVVVDSIVVKPSFKSRITDSVETALKVGKGIVVTRITPVSESAGSKEPADSCEMVFSEEYACPRCGISYAEVEPRIFSFNSPFGACPVCNGLGTRLEFDPDFVVPDKGKSINGGAIEPWKRGGRGYILYYRSLLRELARRLKFDLDAPFKKLDKAFQKAVLYGCDTEIWGKRYEGVIPNLKRLFNETDSEYLKHQISRFMSVLPCPECSGARLKKESLFVKINGRSIYEVVSMTVAEAKKFFESLELSDEQKIISRQILKEISARLQFCVDVGLEYLTLNRQSNTLSGGEAQRIRLATQVGSKLTGVLYILDEPSIGLHQRDNAKLLNTLKALRDLGNTIIVVEHDAETMRSADYIVDLGPGAGRFGGEVVFSGTSDELLKSDKSLTARYLSSQIRINAPEIKRPWQDKKFIEIVGAQEHNLKNINVKFPLGVFICVTGVSGSGKSTLVDEILYRALAQELYNARLKPGRHKKILGAGNIDKAIVVDQSPIGRTPRSCPVTYTGVFGHIRDIFARLPDSKIRGYKPGRFSFNVKGGRCESCAGDGIKNIEMHFLPDVHIKCDACKGKRFNAQTLEVKFKGKSIADVLESSVEEALALFENIPAIRNILGILNDVGLGYIQLGQSAVTLSGGEAQRVKLAAELSRRDTGNTLYLLDEPTTGLHFADVDKLLSVLQRLVDKKNTVVVVEHNLEVIKCADYVVDLGPEGGEAGGYLVAACAPEELPKVKESHTGRYLMAMLTRAPDTSNQDSN